MKILILAALVFLNKIGLAQSSEPLSFQEVVTVDSATKSQLFDRARLWFADYFKSSKAVLEVSDKESGEFIGKPILYTWYKYRFLGSDNKILLDMPVTIRVRVKDGKYKYEIYDVTTRYSPETTVRYSSSKEVFGPLTTSENCPYSYSMISQSKVDQSWNEAKHNAAVIIQKLVDALNDYMNKKTSRPTDDF